MEDNKLVYPIGFDVQQGMKDALSRLGEFDKKIAQVLGKTQKNVIPKEFNLEVNSLKDNIRILTKEWNNLTAAQRSGAAGQRVLKQFNDLRTSAGAYAGTLNQAAKNQIKLATSTTATNTGLNKQSRIMSQLTSQIGMYVSVYALQRFATAVRDITAEFELQRVALTAILQDKAAADKIFGQVVELALESPFRIKDIISYVKQLAAYRVETEKLFETTKRLADISAGLGVDMSRLVLAYGQVRAASVLRGQELRQFTEAGIPLVKLLADKFTELRGVMVSTGEVFELISKRAVPFRMIEEIFNDMTDAGGMFYNMQKIQAETLHGVWANLRDAYDKMYYEIGQKNMGLLKGLGNFLRSLADNWEAVYISIQAVVYGFAAFNIVVKITTVKTAELTAAQIAQIAASKAQVAARLSNIKWTGLATVATNVYARAQEKLAIKTGVLTKAFWKMTAAIASNPIAAIVGAAVIALTALGFAIAKIVKYQTEYEKSVEKLKNKESELSSSRNDELLKLDILYKRLDRAKEGSEEYMAVRDEISSKYGLYLKDLKDEAGNVIELKDAYEQLASKILEAARSRAKTELLNLVSEETVNAQKGIFDEIDKILEEKYGKIQGDEYARRIKISLMKGDEFDEEIKGIISGFNKVSTIVNQEPSLVEILFMGKTRGSQNLVENILDSWMNTFKKTTNDYKELIDDVESDFPDVDVIPKVKEEALAGLKEYVFELESLEERAGGNKIKLYDAKEDVSAFGSNIELLEDVAKKYDEASKHAKFYSDQVTNPKISESERETYKNDLRIANAEKELARNILDRYKALDLIKKLKAGDGETEGVKRLREEINVAKDARAAYENYLKTMTEVRAKQTLEGQLKFAGLNFDISDAGAYREYLQNIYDNIKGDPNYDAVRKLIEDIFVDLDTNAIERELKIKLNKIANDIEKTQKANDFFEKVLGITGDIELSKAITVKFTGVAAGEVGDKLREQLQETLQTALGDQALDISGLDILQIEELINKIPDTMTDVKDKAKSFFDKFSDYIRETKIEALELDEQLKLLGMDDSALFGTGVVLDVQKVVRDLSMANKKLAKEKAQLEAEVAADIRANDKKWYDERMKYIDDSFRQQAANDKTLAQDKLNDLAKAYVEERLFQDGISELLQDVGDKTYSQLSRARKMLQSISDTELIKISDEGMASIESLGYTVDDLMKMESLDKVFLTLGEGISYTDEQLISLLFNMNSLGLSAENVEKLIGEILSGKVSNARVEELKKLSSTVNELSSGIAGILNDSLNLFAGDAPWVDGVQKAIDGFAKLTSAAVELGSEISRAAGKLGEATSNVGGGVAAGGGGIAGAIIAIVGAVIQIGGAVMNIANAVKRQRIEEKVIAVNTELRRLNNTLDLIDRREGLGDGWFTDDAFQDVKNYNHQINELIKSLRSLKGEFNEISKKGSLFAGGATVLDAMSGWDMGDYEDAKKRGYKDAASESVAKLRNMVIGVSDLMFELQHHINAINFDDIDLDKLISYRKALDELNFADDEADYEAMRDSMIKQIDLIESALSNFKDSIRKIVGEISEDMRTTFNETWKNIEKNGKAAFVEIADTIKSEVGGVLGEMASSQMWNAIMKPYFDRLGAGLGELILNEGSQADMIKLMDDFWSGATDGMLDYQNAWEEFVEASKKSKWNVFEDALELPEDSITQIREKISKLKSEYENMSEEERGGDYDGIALLQKIKELEKALAKVEDAAAAADSRISKLLDGEEDRRRQAELLLSFARNTTDQYERQYALQKRQEILAEEHANLYSQYAPDAQAFEDELSKMNDDLEWAIENGYPELAKWIEQAFDTKILDDWRSKLEEAMSGKSDIEQYKYLQSKIEETQKEYVIAASTGHYDNATRLWEELSEMRDQLEDVRQGILDDLYTKYSSDEQKYLAELKEYSDAIGFAVGQGWIDVAKMIESAMKEYKLDYWSDGIGDELEAMDSYVDKLSFIDSELAKLEGLTATGIDGTYENMQYNDLLEQRGKILDGLYDSYQTERESYEENIKVLEDVKKAFEEVGDMVKADYIQSLIDQATYDYNLDGLEKEFEKQFGDISDMGADEVKKMLDAFKQQIEDSDISEEQKKKILEDIDDIYDELDRRTQEAFNNIADAIRSIKSLLETVGADKAIVDSFGAIADAIGIIGDLTYAIASGDWWNVFNLAIKLINATISAIKNLVQYLKGDPFAGVEAIGVRITNAEKAVQKAVGTSVKPAQESLLSAYQDAIDELNKGIAEEEAKPDGFFAKLFGLDTDEEAIAKAKEQIADYEDLMEEVRESMKADFLQTDYASFSDSLAEILIQPWDSYMEMMDAVKELTDDTINNIVRHALSLHLQSQIKDALDALYERGIGDESLELFRQDVAKIVKDGQSVAKYYGQFYDDLASSSEAYDTISRITESQANSFLGYYQNYLIIMTDMHNIMKRIWDNMNRQSVNINLDAHLTALHTIAANTGAIANNTSRIGAMADDIRIMKNSLAKSGAY